MYLHRRTWLENGPRGMGDTVPYWDLPNVGQGGSLPYWLYPGGLMPLPGQNAARGLPNPPDAIELTNRVAAPPPAPARPMMPAAPVRAIQPRPSTPAAPSYDVPAKVAYARAHAKTIPVPQVLARKGVGVLQLSTDYCQSGWSLLNPVAWLGGCAASDVSDVYQQVMYGGPAPAVVPPPAPTVNLTSSPAKPGAVYAGADSSGNPIYAVPSTAADSQAAIVAGQNAAIDAAVAAGYNPAGNYPAFTALNLSDFFNKYGTYVFMGAAALGGLALFKAVKK